MSKQEFTKSRIYLAKPSITEKEVNYAAEAARYGWGDRCYDYVKRFEAMFREFVDTKYAIATSSCTGALHMGLAAMGIEQGDEVILADINWIASAAPIVYLGAKPVFVDILSDSWCLDPEQVEAAITPKTKAIIAVHLYGNLCEMDRLLEISQRHNVPLIEDAAEALGSRWYGKHAGSMGWFGTFSFHGSKTLTTGEGGMLVTNDSELYEQVLTLNNHGRTRHQTKQFWADTIGYKYKMSNLQAAIGCAQMERIEELIAGKRRIFNYYASKLQNCSIQMNPEPPHTENGFWMPTVVWDRDRNIRESLMEDFKKQNIDARVFFYPLSLLPMFESKANNIRSYNIHQRAINLPSYHDLTKDEQERVVDVLKRCL